MKSTTLRITLPLPPSVNHQYNPVFSPRKQNALSNTRPLRMFVEDPATKAWKETAHLLMLAAGWHLHSFGKDAILSVHYVMSSRADRDLDNILKPMLDVASKVIRVNDNRVMVLRGRKIVAGKDDRNVRLSIRVLE